MPTIDAVLERAAFEAPSQDAVWEWDSGRRITYGSLNRDVSAFAAWLQAAPIGAGGTVAIHLPNSIGYLVGQFGTWRAGGCAAYVNYRLAPMEAARQMTLAGTRVVLTTAARAAELREIEGLSNAVFVVDDNRRPSFATPLANILAQGGRPAAPVGAEDADAIARFTSGSTGVPKGVLVSHRAWLLRAASMLAEQIQIEPRSTTMVLGPLSHQAGLFVLPTFLRRGCVLIFDRFDVEAVSAALTTQSISCSQMVPTIMGFMVESAATRDALRNAGLRRLCYGGSPVQRPVLDTVLDLLPGTEVVQSYGSHEAGSIAYLDGTAHRDPAMRSSAGRPMLGVEIRLNRAPGAEYGEIEVRSPWVPGARLGPNGREVAPTDWVRTGDLGELQDGFLFLKDRANDVIVSGGFNVYPLEVEAVIDASPEVRACAVVSCPDDKWGERVVAFVVPRAAGSFEEGALRAHCRDRLATYKVPKEFRLVADIPQNVNGKPDRRRLSAPLWEGRERRIN